jgi:DNA-binding transcriptional MerR regulator
MTIKDIELASGMMRANIRYYEHEGLIAPSRLANGYRNYSAEDLATLKRVKLLRSLKISIEEIKALQDGATDLSDILTLKINELEELKNDAAGAQELCRALQEDRVTYETLDAEKYLAALPQPKSGAVCLNMEQEPVTGVFHPWRRYFARMLDFSIYSAIWLAVLALGFHVNVPAMAGRMSFFNTLVAGLLMLFLEPLLLQLFGTTPGKWIFGLHLEDEDGCRPAYSDGFDRTLTAIGLGLGYFIPITIWSGSGKATKLPRKREAAMGRRACLFHPGPEALPGCLLVLAQVLLTVAMVIVFSAAQLPPNRGELTVSEFAENYNTLANYYNVYTGLRLDDKGMWTDNLDDGHSISPSRPDLRCPSLILRTPSKTDGDRHPARNGAERQRYVDPVLYRTDGDGRPGLCRRPERHRPAVRRQRQDRQSHRRPHA